MLVAGDSERVEIGQQMAPDAVGADQHDHPQMIDDQPPGPLAAQVDHVAAERGRQRLGRRISVAARQERRAALLEQAPGLRAELVEIAPPAGIDAGGVGQITGIEVFDEGAVAAVEEGGLLDLASLRHGLGFRFRA